MLVLVFLSNYSYNNHVRFQLVSAEGSNVSDGGASQCADNVTQKMPDHGWVDFEIPFSVLFFVVVEKKYFGTDFVWNFWFYSSHRPNSDDFINTETESLASSKPGTITFYLFNLDFVVFWWILFNFVALHHIPKDRLRPLTDRYEKHHKYNGIFTLWSLIDNFLIYFLWITDVLFFSPQA